VGLPVYAHQLDLHYSSHSSFCNAFRWGPYKSTRAPQEREAWIVWTSPQVGVRALKKEWENRLVRQTIPSNIKTTGICVFVLTFWETKIKTFACLTSKTNHADFEMGRPLLDFPSWTSGLLSRNYESPAKTWYDRIPCALAGRPALQIL